MTKPVTVETRIDAIRKRIDSTNGIDWENTMYIDGASNKAVETFVIFGRQILLAMINKVKFNFPIPNVIQEKIAFIEDNYSELPTGRLIMAKELNNQYWEILENTLNDNTVVKRVKGQENSRFIINLKKDYEFLKELI